MKGREIMSSGQQGLLDHRMAVLGSDEEYVAAAVPFLREGIAAPDEPPPLMISTAVKLDLVRDALGADARHVEFIPNVEWYTGSAANALAQAAGYVATHAGPGGCIHAIAEPDWTGRPGRSARESAEWIRYEALVNVLLAPLAVTALCPYDERTTSPEIVAAARRTHPNEVRGASPSYTDPFALIAELNAAPLPGRPAGAAEVRLDGDPGAVCAFVRAQAAAHGLDPVEAGVFESAVAEVVHNAPAGTIVRAWPMSGASVCEVAAPSGRLDDILIGFRPPDTLEVQPGQGLWFTRQVCDYVDVRSGADGWRVRMQSRPPR